MTVGHIATEQMFLAARPGSRSPAASRGARFAILLVVCLTVLCSSSPSGAQDEDARLINLALRDGRPRSLSLESAYIDATDAIAARRWSEAVDALTRIIDAPEDGYREVLIRFNNDGTLSDDSAEENRSLKQRAATLLSEMPKEGLSVYRERFEAPAAAALASVRPLSADYLRIALRYRWTEAGRSALLRAAASALDSGRDLDAALLLESLQLREEQTPAEIRQRLNLIANRNQESRRADLTRDAATQWLRPGGSPRGSVASGGSPVASSVLFRRAAIEDYDAAGQLETLAASLSSAMRALERSAASTYPVRNAIEPLIVNDTAIFAGLGRVRAYDIRTGKLRWRSALIDRSFYYLTRRMLGDDQAKESQRVRWLLERSLIDRTAGSLSSDGSTVFTVIDGGSDIDDDNESPPATKHPLARATSNRLVAIEAATGRIRWWIGGANTGVLSAPLAGTFFLGPPAFVDGRAYVLGEQSMQARLFELDLATGNVLSSQDLWNNSARAFRVGVVEPSRGIMPLVVGSKLICPLRDIIAAVDPRTHTLEWMRPRVLARNQYAPDFGGSPFAGLSDPFLAACYRNCPSDLVAANTIVSLGVNRVSSFDATTGALIWDRPRGDIIWFEHVTDSGLLVVSLDGVQCLDATTGEIRWSRQLPPVSGSGLERDGTYTLPLMPGDVVTLDLDDGEIIARTPVFGSDRLGTLVGANGQTLSFNGTELVALTPINAMPESLTAAIEQGGRIPLDYAAYLLHAGRSDDAIELLSQVIDQSPDQTSGEVQTLLASALLSSRGLDSESVTTLASRIDLDQLAPSIGLKLRILFADQARDAGDVAGEVRQHVAIVALPTIRELIVRAPDRRITWQQQSSARLLELAETIDGDGLASARSAVREQLDAFDPAARQRVAGKIPLPFLTPEAAVTLAGEASRPIQQELLLRAVIGFFPTAAEPIESARVALAQLYFDAGRWADFRAIVGEIQGVTDKGRAFLKLDNVNEALATHGDNWSSGPISVSFRQRLVPPDGFRSVTVRSASAPTSESNEQSPTVGSRWVSRSLSKWSANPRGTNIQLRNRNGALVESFASNTTLSVFTNRILGVETLAHLAALETVDGFEVLDTLSHPIVRLASASTAPGGNRRISVDRSAETNGLRTRLQSARGGLRFGTLGPLTLSTLTYLRDDQLVALDPVSPTRGPLWITSGLEAGSELFGDSRVVIAHPRSGNTLKAFRLSDGVEVPCAPLPATTWRDLGDCLVGRSILCRDEAAAPVPEGEAVKASASVSLYDPITDAIRWRLEFAAATQLSRHGDLLMAYDTTAKNVTLFDVRTGAELASAALELEVEASPSLVRLGTNVFVFGGNRPTEKLVGNYSERHARPIVNSSSDSFLVNGPVIAFDLENGETIWTREIVDQQFPTDQFEQWPFLVFASNYVVPRGDGSNIVDRAMRVEFVNKSTGETLWSDDQLPYNKGFQVSPLGGDTAGLMFGFGGFRLTVRQANEPAPEKPNANETTDALPEPGGPDGD